MAGPQSNVTVDVVTGIGIIIHLVGTGAAVVVVTWGCTKSATRPAKTMVLTAVPAQTMTHDAEEDASPPFALVKLPLPTPTKLYCGTISYLPLPLPTSR